jgi:hypothetical protein
MTHEGGPSGTKKRREEPPGPSGEDDIHMKDDDYKATGLTPKSFYKLLLDNARQAFHGLDMTYDVNGEMAFSQVVHAMSSPVGKETPLPQNLTKFFENKMTVVA